MSTAPNIKFTPAKSDGPTMPRRKRGFTTLDNETELKLLGRLPNALVQPALFLLSRRYLKGGTNWGEVAGFCERGQTQTAAALAMLEHLGLALSQDGQWFWNAKFKVTPGNLREISGKLPESRRKPGMKAAKNAVQDSKKSTPKERSKEVKKKRTTTTAKIRASLPEASGTDVGAVAAGTLQQELQTPSQPPETGSGATQEVKTAAQDPEGVPPAAPGDYNTAMTVVRAAGLLDDWRSWITFAGLKRSVQHTQIGYWSQWISAGHAEVLQREAKDISLCNFDHPFKALKARIDRAEREVVSGQQNTAQVSALFGEPICQPDERRVAPDGKIWTVAYVEYGSVYFEELNSPELQLDSQVAKWALAGASA